MPDVYQFGAIIIGAGQAGVPLAKCLALEKGLRTALIERNHVGGTCINEGCTPTKTMVASARIAYLARRAAEYGVHTGPVTVDLARIRQRKRDIVESWRGGSEGRLKKTERLELIYGEARFVGPRTIEVQTVDPQLGRIGMTEREARAAGCNIRVAKMPMSHVARAIEVGETRGFVKAVVDAETDQILGAAVLGIEGGELMSIVQVAMMSKVPYTTIEDDIFAHPTLTESLNNLFLAWEPEPMDVILSQAAYSATMMAEGTARR